MEKETKFRESLMSIFIVLLGNFIYALTVKFFLIPGGLVTGGSTGIALTLHHYFALPVSAFVMIFNLFMLLLGLVGLGKKFVLTTILSSFAYPLSLGLLDKVLGEVFVTDDVLLNTIFAGLGIGVAVGIVIRTGASTGGMDVPPLILQKYVRIPVAVSLYVFDTCILLSQAVFNDLEKLLYGCVLVFIYTVVIDKVLIMGTTHTEIKIISKKSEEVKRAIIEEMDRGITILNGRGGYLEKDTDVILTVVSGREVPRVEKLVHSIDQEAFMTISKVSEVRGRGFSLNKMYK